LIVVSNPRDVVLKGPVVATHFYLMLKLGNTSSNGFPEHGKVIYGAYRFILFVWTKRMATNAL